MPSPQLSAIPSSSTMARPRSGSGSAEWVPPPKGGHQLRCASSRGCRGLLTSSSVFVPTLLGQPDQQQEHEFLYWEFHERGFSQAALYQGRWKGIRERRIDAPLQLYDLANDIGEKMNVADDHSEIVTRINAYLKTARSDSPDWPVTKAD